MYYWEAKHNSKQVCYANDIDGVAYGWSSVFWVCFCSVSHGRYHSEWGDYVLDIRAGQQNLDMIGEGAFTAFTSLEVSKGVVYGPIVTQVIFSKIQ